MVQLSSGIGNVTTNTELVEMAMAYSRSRMLCAAARLGIADALGDELRSVGFLAENCQAGADALYRLLRALASMLSISEEALNGLGTILKPLTQDVGPWRYNPRPIGGEYVFAQVRSPDNSAEGNYCTALKPIISSPSFCSGRIRVQMTV
jgi:hypothetical protein